jgi:hypothetical protein
VKALSLIIILLIISVPFSLLFADYKLISTGLSEDTKKIQKYTKILSKYGENDIPKIQEYYQSSDSRKRLCAYSRLGKIAESTHNPSLKRKIAEMLVVKLNDKSNFATISFILEKLLNYFSVKAKNQLLKYFENGLEPKEQIIELLGTANVRKAIPKLEKLLVYEKADKIDMSLPRFSRYNWHVTKKQRISWYARRTLARLGVKEQIEKCIEILNAKYPKKRDWWLSVDDLNYIRQPQTMDILLRYMNSGYNFSEGDFRHPLPEVTVCVFLKSLRKIDVDLKN